MQGHGEHAQIGFIGGGNMARAMIGGLIAAGHPVNEIRVAEPDAAQRASLNAQWPDLNTSDDNTAVANWSTLCVLAVKPQVMPDVAQALSAERLAMKPHSPVNRRFRERSRVQALPGQAAA